MFPLHGRHRPNPTNQLPWLALSTHVRRSRLLRLLGGQQSLS